MCVCVCFQGTWHRYVRSGAEATTPHPSSVCCYVNIKNRLFCIRLLNELNALPNIRVFVVAGGTSSYVQKAVNHGKWPRPLACFLFSVFLWFIVEIGCDHRGRDGVRQDHANDAVSARGGLYTVSLCFKDSPVYILVYSILHFFLPREHRNAPRGCWFCARVFSFLMYCATLLGPTRGKSYYATNTLRHLLLVYSAVRSLSDRLIFNVGIFGRREGLLFFIRCLIWSFTRKFYFLYHRRSHRFLDDISLISLTNNRAMYMKTFRDILLWLAQNKLMLENIYIYQQRAGRPSRAMKTEKIKKYYY